ncbi:J domain-containing protein [Streptomyces sp. NPDC018045]|uniref:J domain-containing protein n=1 Tax=Streptomyces sp. NPDC018045 TaxID=3365037 RepID=UPI00378C2664
MPVRQCEECFTALPKQARAHAKYCGPTCRKRASRGGPSRVRNTVAWSCCARCGEAFQWVRARAGHTRLYCSNACSQAAYRQRAKEEQEGFSDWWERVKDSYAGAGGSAGGRAYADPVMEARRIVFEIADMTDDGTAPTLKAAYKVAARRHHPDLGGSTQAFQRLEQARQVLKDAGHFR